MKCSVCNGPKIDHEVIINGKFVCKPACLYKAIGRKPPMDNIRFALPFIIVAIILCALMKLGIL